MDFLPIWVGLVAGAAAGALLAVGLGRLGWLRARLQGWSSCMRAFQLSASDDEKGRILRHAGASMLLTSLACLLFFVALGALLLAWPAWLAGPRDDFVPYWVMATAVSAAVALTCRRAAVKEDYRLIDRLLYWIVLNPSLVRRVCFDLDVAAVSRRRQNLDQWYEDRPVFICGMARSGTTMLLRLLSSVPRFRSLTYSDMPFVLAPNTWKTISRPHRKVVPTAERAHGDGILVDLESPEAFEEVFWRTFSGLKVLDDRISATEPSLEELHRFETYRRIVVASTPGEGRGRYLSKNNNNLLRLTGLTGINDTVLVSYRDPFATARSSHNQHVRFCVEQRRNPFVRDYMRWLAHHEFGLDHRPLGVIDPALLPGEGPESLDYWLAYWTLLHRYILGLAESRFVLVDHDALRAHPETVISRLLARLGVDADVKQLAATIKRETPASQSGFSAVLARDALRTYESLRADPRNLIHMEH